MKQKNQRETQIKKATEQTTKHRQKHNNKY